MFYTIKMTWQSVDPTIQSYDPILWAASDPKYNHGSDNLDNTFPICKTRSNEENTVQFLITIRRTEEINWSRIHCWIKMLCRTILGRWRLVNHCEKKWVLEERWGSWKKKSEMLWYHVRIMMFAREKQIESKKEFYSFNW